jgi:hypothetical protein
MTQSKYSALFYIPLIAIFIALTFFVLTVAEFFVDYLKIPSQNKIILVGLTIFLILWLLILFIELSENAKIISIDKVSKTISFTNYFTKKIKTFSFKEFDGHFETVIKHGKSRRRYDAFGLSKEKLVIYRIDSYYYSNYEELKDGLSVMESLGYFEFGFIDNIKILLKQSVIT